jgi:hypothetical protein
MLSALEGLGIGYDEAQKLRRISMTLQRWFELECGDSDDYRSWAIERDEESDMPYLVSHYYRSLAGHESRHRIADKEKGARKRLAAIMAGHPELVAYVQTDPRGCALYILKASDLRQDGKLLEIESHYTRGIAVY